MGTDPGMYTGMSMGIATNIDMGTDIDMHWGLGKD